MEEEQVRIDAAKDIAVQKLHQLLKGYNIEILGWGEPTDSHRPFLHHTQYALGFKIRTRVYHIYFYVGDMEDGRRDIIENIIRRQIKEYELTAIP